MLILAVRRKVPMDYFLRHSDQLGASRRLHIVPLERSIVGLVIGVTTYR